MREVQGDLWDFEWSIRAITTNGNVSGATGFAIMGAGIAKQAARRYPDLPELLGRSIETQGNHVCVIGQDIVAFPVKHNWWQKANLDLIRRSAEELLALTNEMGWHHVAMPRPGCGKGLLDWDEVRPVLEDVFGEDTRFVIVDKS